MGFSLRNLGSRIWDQVNPWDSGRTYQQRTPVAPQPTWRPPMALPQRSTASRVYDQFNIFDNNRTFKNSLPTNNKSAWQQAGQFSGQAARGTIGNTATFLNTAEGARQQLVPTFKGQVAMMTGNQEALTNAIKEQSDNYQKYFGKGKGILGTGTYVSPEEAMRGDITEILPRATGNLLGAGLEIGSLGMGSFAGKQLINQGIKQGFKSQIPILGKTAILNTAQGGVDAWNQGSRDPGEIAKASATSGILGTVGDVGLGVAGAGITKMVDGNIRPVYAAGPDVMPEAVAGAKKIVDEPQVGKVNEPKVSDTKIDEPKAPRKDVQIEAAKNSVVTRFMREMVDDDAYIIKQLKQVEKVMPDLKGAVGEFYYRSGMTRGSNRVANVKFANSDNIKAAIDGLDDVNYERFGDYANARTELASALSRKTPKGKQAKVKTSKSIEELKKIVKEGDAEFSDRFGSLNQYYAELTDYLQEAGVISGKKAAQYKSSKDYIRIQRDMEDLVESQYGKSSRYSIGSTQSALKRRGSERAILPPAETALHYTQQVFREAWKNKTANHLIDTLEPVGLAKRTSRTTGKNTIAVMKNGQTVHYEVSPDMKMAVDNINPYTMNTLLKILGAPGRTFRAGTTGLNPVFIAKNWIRDEVGSAINSEHILKTHNPMAIGDGLISAVRDSVGMMDEPIYQDFLMHYGNITSFDLTRDVLGIKDEVARLRGGTPTKIAQGFKHPIKSLEGFASVTEKSTRFQNYKAVYKKVLEETKDVHEAHQKAALASWQNSVDFSRAGRLGRTLNAVIPYWNPATQGVRQMTRTMANHPIKSGAAATALVGMPMVVSTAWNLSDPDTKAIYDDIEDYEKENNLILVLSGERDEQGNATDIIKIPLAPGWKDLYRPFTRAMEDYITNKPQQGAQLANDFLQAFTGPVQTGTKEQFVGSLLPTAAKVPFEQSINKTLYTGKPIVPDYMNDTHPDGTPIEEEKKAYKGTSGTARMIGGVTNQSPLKVEKAIKDIFGEVGMEGLNLSDNILAKTDKIPDEQIGGRSVRESFNRAFGEASAANNPNKSEGAKFIEKREQRKKDLGFTQNDEALLGALKPKRKNFLGEEMAPDDLGIYNPERRMTAFLDDNGNLTKVYQLLKQENEDSRKAGKPADPMFDLEIGQLKKVLEKDKMTAGQKDKELDILRQQEWYQDYSNKKTAFFDQLKAIAEKEGRTFGDPNNPYPTKPEGLQEVMDGYFNLPKGTGARSAWIRSNPALWQTMQKYWADIDNWENGERKKRGLDPTEGEEGEKLGYGDEQTSYSKSGYSRGGGGGGSSNPDVINPSRFAIGFQSGKKPNTSIKGVDSKALVGKSKKKGTTKPKVTIKKSKV